MPDPPQTEPQARAAAPRRPVPVRGGPGGGGACLAVALAAVAALLGAPEGAAGQQRDTARAGPPPREVPSEPDTTRGPPISPAGAFARSVVLPGWGQAEVDAPIRGAFYFVAEAASLWMVLKSQAKLASARRAAGDVGPDEDTPLVDSRTTQRENWIVISVFVALFSGVDAWVSTHLYEFEGELEPPEDGTAGAKLGYSVPLEFP